MTDHSIGYKIDGTPICVDYWNVSDDDQAADRFYFLTHAHDHSMFGLTPSWRRRIYCSPVTAKIMAALQELQPSSFVLISIGETLSIDCRRIRGCEGKSFNVTALDAHHCPGSTMFLFEGWFGRVLATGGFRYENEYDFDIRRLREMAIDQIYLDVTNWKREEELGMVLTTRTCSLVKALEIIAKRPVGEMIFLVTPEAAVGQERLLVDIAKNFGERIAVPGHRLKVLKEIEDIDVFTEDPQETRFRLINGTKGQIIRMFTDEVKSGKVVCIVVFATPAMALNWEDVRTVVNGKNYELGRCIHFVPYSDHSTMIELERFLNHLTFRRLHFTGRRLDQNETELLRRQFQKFVDVSDTTESIVNAGEDDALLLDSLSPEPVAPDSACQVEEEPAVQNLEESRPSTALRSNDGPESVCVRSVDEEAVAEDPEESLEELLSEDEPPAGMEAQQQEAAVRERLDTSTDQANFIFNEANNMVFTQKELDALLALRDFSLF